MTVKIKPVVWDPNPSGGKLKYMEDAEFHRLNYRDISMTGSRLSDIVGKLRSYKDTMIRHTFGAPFFTKASVDEVVAQIPQDDRKRCAGFETLLSSAEVSPEDIKVIFTKTRLYEKV